MPTDTRIITVGNVYRGDDAVGPLVAELLRAAGMPVADASGEGAALIEAWRGAGRVFLVDAVRSGAEPGTIHRIDAHREQLPSGFFQYTTHAFSVAEAVELARVLGELPPQVIVYGIEGASFRAGSPLTPAVRRAGEAVAARLVVEVGGPEAERHSSGNRPVHGPPVTYGPPTSCL